MSESSTHTVERIARVLAGERLSSNAEGADPSAADTVDARWPEHQFEAEAILRSLREAPPEIAALGEGEAWSRAIAAALGEQSAEANQPGKLEELKKSVEHFLQAPS